EGVRDFALVASTAFTVSTAQVGGATVAVYALRPELARRYLDIAKRYVEFYGRFFALYPYPELDVVEVEFSAGYGGMEYPGLVMLAADTDVPDPPDNSYAEYLVAHEI